MGKRSPHRDALRLLFIFVTGSSALPQDDSSGATAVFKGEARLYALEFWIRNPDYLAEELLNVYENTGNEAHLRAAQEIFKAEEPDLRRFPMIRWRFGAYERLDDTLAILTSRRLVKITGRKAGEKVLETDFLIMPSAFALTDRITAEFPELMWYADRAKLVVELAGSRGGGALKEHQHKQIEYHQAIFGGIIPAIKSRVQARLEALLTKAGKHDETSSR